MVFAISAIIIIGAIAAVAVEKHRKGYCFNQLQCVFAAVSIISAIVVSIILIVCQTSCADIKKWMGCILLIISMAVCVVFYAIYREYEEKFETMYPLVSITANMLVLYFGVMMITAA